MKGVSVTLLLCFISQACCFFNPQLPLWKPTLRKAAIGVLPRSSRRVVAANLRLADGTESEKLAVAVIGGGPAGLAAAANLLDVDSVGSVTVVERAGAETFSDGPGTWGIGCGPRAQALLGNITGNPWAASIKDQCLHNARTDNYRGNRPIIREGIYKALCSHPKAGGRLNIEFGTTVTKFDVPGKTLELANSKHVDYDCLVLADGSHSSSLAAIAKPEFETERRAFWSCVKIMPAKEIPDDTRTYMFKKDKCTVWLLSWKDGGRYILVFFEVDKKLGRNPARDLKTPADLRALLHQMEPLALMGPKPTFDVPAYWDSLSDEVLADFLVREPRPMWYSRTKASVDTGSGIVLIGDTSGTTLPTLGAGTCMALQDAANLKTSFEQAEQAAGGGGGKRVLEGALQHYGRTGAEERKAMVLLNLLCMAIRQKWGKRVPVLKRLDRWVTEKVEDPGVTLVSLVRRPFVWPFVWLAKLMWERVWGLREEYVREWRAGAVGSQGAKGVEELQEGSAAQRLQQSGAA